MWVTEGAWHARGEYDMARSRVSYPGTARGGARTVMTRNHQLRALDLRRQATLDVVVNISRQDSRDARRGPYAQYARTSIA